MTEAERHPPNVGIVIPTYEEAANIPLLLEKVFRAAPDSHVLIVDDNSPDGTAETAREWAEMHHRAVKVLARPQKEGLGRAYVAAFQHLLRAYPDWQYIVHMDADLSHDPVAIPELVAAAAGSDLVIGSRYNGGSIENWSSWRLIVSKCANALARACTGLPLRDCTSGYRCMNREVLQQIDLNTIRSNGYAFLVEFAFRAHRAGCSIAEIPITFSERREGKSKLGLPIALEAARTLIRLAAERRR
jgi:dolichol-phosphate mannosyltransferase